MVLNSGVTAATPYGMLRKLGSSESVDGGFGIQAEQAALTDAIEKCNVSFTAEPDAEEGVSVSQGGNTTRFSLVEQAYAADALGEGLGQAIDGLKEAAGQELEFIDFDAGSTIDGSLKVNNFKVDHMNIVDHAFASMDLKSLDFDLYSTLKKAIDGKDSKKTGGQDDSKKNTGSAKKRPVVVEGSHLDEDEEKLVLLSVECPISVYVGPLQLVLSCRFDLDISLEAFCNGVTFDRTFGFDYTAEGGTRIINDDNFRSPYFSFGDPGRRVSVGADASLTGTLSCLAYNVAGPELTVGLVGEADGLLRQMEPDEGGEDAIRLPGINNDFSGRFNVKVYVPITCRILVKADNLLGFINGELINVELFDSGDTLTFAEADWRFGTVWEEVKVDLAEGYRDLAFYVPDDWGVSQSDGFNGGGYDEAHVVVAYPDYLKSQLSSPYSGDVTEYVNLDYLYGQLSDMSMAGGGVSTVRLEEVAPADFIPLSQNGVFFENYDSFVVAKTYVLESELRCGIKEVYASEGKDEFSLVLVPKSWIGTMEAPTLSMGLAFPYGGPNGAASDGFHGIHEISNPDGGIGFGYYGSASELSEEEYKTVVDVLASLRAV